MSLYFYIIKIVLVSKVLPGETFMIEDIFVVVVVVTHFQNGSKLKFVSKMVIFARLSTGLYT